MVRPLPPVSFLALSLLSATVPAHAQDAERALLIVDPSNAESMHVANHYRAARGIPARNVLYMDPAAASYPEQVAVQVRAFLGELAQRGIEDQVDLVVLSPTDTFYVPASGLVSDTCSAVNRFALPTAFTLARISDKVLDGGLSSTSINHYKRNGYGARAFQSALSWYQGQPSEAGNAEGYFLTTMLGWTGTLGNTRQEVLDMIDRSVATDGTFPGGTVYYCQTNDTARSGPRHDTYPEAVAEMIAAGGQAQHLFANLPFGQTDAMGVMTGLADPPIDDTSWDLIDGSFADHLTSYAATFTTSSQTKMTRWIAKGASGTSGTVEEPCNYAGKFPHARLHVVYRKGLTLGEAWFRSIGFKPFQILFLGDPLTRPYGGYPVVDVPNPPPGPVTGLLVLSATASAPSGNVDELELLVDGLRVQTVPLGTPFLFDTASLADGPHELRVRGFDDTIVRTPGVWTGTVETANHGKALSLAGSASTGDLGAAFDLSWTASGGVPDEVVLTGGGRVLAAGAGAAGSAVVFGQNLGGGATEVVAEARFPDGTRAVSAPFAIDVDPTGGGAATAPTAFSYTLHVRDDAAFVVALPAAFADDPATVSYAVTSAPGQVALLGGSGPWRAFQPDLATAGSDVLDWTVTTAGGSASGTVTIVYDDLDGCPPVETFCVGSPNSAGDGLRLVPSGSTSVAANDLVLKASGGPANQFGLVFYGPQQTSVPVGDGVVCVGGKTWRLSAVQLDAAGARDIPLDLTDPPHPDGQITVGSSWAFQFWYRDPGFGSSGFNFSDALWATFCP